MPSQAADPAYALNGTMGSLAALIDNDTAVTWDGSTIGEINVKLQNDADAGVFTAYKLLDVSKYTDNTLKVSIPTTDGGKAQAFWNTYTGKTTATITDIKNTLNGQVDATAQSRSIVDAFLNYEGAKPTGVTSALNGTNIAKITADFGFYIIQQTLPSSGSYIASAPIVACLPMKGTDSLWKSVYTAKPKDDDVTLTKKVKATGDGFKDETITNIGDTVTYEIKAKLPVYGDDILADANFKYIIKDTLPSGVTYDDGSVSIEFKDAGVNYIDKSTEYKLVKDESILTLTNTDGSAISGSDYKTNIMDQGYKYVKIQFSATLNGDATIEGIGNENKVALDYSSAVGSYKTLTASAKVYTLRLDITKIDKDGGAPLSGAEFQVYKNAGDVSDENKAITFIALSDIDGVKAYRVATDGESGTKTIVVTTSDVEAKRGKVIIQGLDDTTYYFKETVAPTGYTKPSSPFAIEVKPGTEDHVSGTDLTLAFKNPIQTASIENTTTIDLPTTGGIGTIVFTAGGVLLMAGALFFLFGNKKKEEK